MPALLQCVPAACLLIFLRRAALLCPGALPCPALGVQDQVHENEYNAKKTELRNMKILNMRARGRCAQAVQGGV